ncbi:phosphorylase [Alcaligenes nematophilus]|uniref:Phosphorylase n=1 Tax=Alcaligenes nematophilus TaxID=2994643 RepID=A0ABU3MQ49_9BURK|nr:phosphorylase [Alcaligenes nematophilus]MDT8463534.1 phosphorylase [Alcaligenes nematophilus]MDT8470434.1 phosphorylase [Alcaligenes nematophilus]MDT8502790.1 phosphorylase [Alcaligenes nematophilus]MDT8525645.1 phosphorylase [Alcaligenes nematophilus]
MSKEILQRLDQLSQAALASGDLLPVQAQEELIHDQGLTFFVRWVSTLAAKDAASVSIPGGPRDPNFNPFLPPAPALTVDDASSTHNIVLNKFAVCDLHLVLADKVFSEQLSPLREIDFRILADFLAVQGGLGFYNGGGPAGASQRHKHTQWIPQAAGNGSLALYLDKLPTQAAAGSAHQHPALAFEHCFVRLQDAQEPEVLAASLLSSYRTACNELGLEPAEDGLLPPHNMLAGQGWMLVVPRSVELVDGISVNALSYAGCIYVRTPEQIDLVRQIGPLGVLARAGYARRA